MKAIKVNADYELMLFEQRPGPRMLSESLEFLSFYLEDAPVVSEKKYDPNYLEHIQSLTGQVPQIIKTKEFVNWWGSLTNIPLEKRLNSKEVVINFNPDSHIYSPEACPQFRPGITYLVKSLYGMSGQNFKTFTPDEWDTIQTSLNDKKVLIEPLLERKKDFSHYVLSSNETICYENLIDRSFQYKGSLFRNLRNPDLEHLSFYHEVETEIWLKFQEKMKEIIDYCSSLGAHGGYSIDSFTYAQNKKLFVRAISEINYRKTMGLLAWMISKQFCGANTWSLFVLTKPIKVNTSFDHLKEKMKPILWNSNLQSGCLILSPGDTRFNIFLLSAMDEVEGRILFNTFQSLLPDGELTIEI